jgi:hypothetical protein
MGDSWGTVNNDNTAPARSQYTQERPAEPAGSSDLHWRRVRTPATRFEETFETFLQAQADDDMNAALHELSNSTLSAMHQQGYVLAIERLHTMQQDSALLSQPKDLAICVDLQEKFERWCNLVPETWVVRLSDGRSEPVLHELFQNREDRMTVHQDVNDALACLEQASPDATTFLLTVREDLVADDPVAAAQAAAESTAYSLRTFDTAAQ